MLGGMIGASNREPKYTFTCWIRMYKEDRSFEDTQIKATDVDVIEFVDAERNAIVGRIIVNSIEPTK